MKFLRQELLGIKMVKLKTNYEPSTASVHIRMSVS